MCGHERERAPGPEGFPFTTSAEFLTFRIISNESGVHGGMGGGILFAALSAWAK